MRPWMHDAFFAKSERAQEFDAVRRTVPAVPYFPADELVFVSP